MQIKIDDLIITIEGPRPDRSYAAWFGDYDLGCMEGWGMTPQTAAADLFDKHADYLQDRLAARFAKLAA